MSSRAMPSRFSAGSDEAPQSIRKLTRVAGDVKAGVEPAAGTERVAAADKSQLHRLQPPCATYRPRGAPNSRDSSQIGITITAPSRK